MKFYYFDTEFTFGKFKGKTFWDILEIRPSYLEWCLLHLDQFVISDYEFGQIKLNYPNFNISEAANQKRLEKIQSYEQERASRATIENIKHANEENFDDIQPRWTEDDMELANWDYDPMNPSHDPSENPWIDVFGPGDEAEAAYWNTD